MIKNDKINIFVLSTSYQFLLAMAIIEERFKFSACKNILVFTSMRLSSVDIDRLPDYVEVVKIYPGAADSFKDKVDSLLIKHKADNLFVVHSFRPLDYYFLYRTPNGTKRNLLQDGAYFYARIRKNVFLSSIKQTMVLYLGLLKNGIILKSLPFRYRYLQRSRFVDHLWMTNPEIYAAPEGCEKPISKINLFPDKKSVEIVRSYFKINADVNLDKLDNYLIYLSPNIKDKENCLIEAEQIKRIISNLKVSGVLIKLHPLSPSSQYDLLRKEFGNVVIKDFNPAELYIACARDSYVIGSASTAFFYYNPGCKYFALKKLYQKLGIYAYWKDVSLPDYVKIVENIRDIY